MTCAEANNYCGPCSPSFLSSFSYFFFVLFYFCVCCDFSVFPVCLFFIVFFFFRMLKPFSSLPRVTLCGGQCYVLFVRRRKQITEAFGFGRKIFFDYYYYYYYFAARFVSPPAKKKKKKKNFGKADPPAASIHSVASPRPASHLTAPAARAYHPIRHGLSYKQRSIPKKSSLRLVI